MATSRAADDKLNGKLMVTGRSINHALNVKRVIVLVNGNAPSRLPAETELRISLLQASAVAAVRSKKNFIGRKLTSRVDVR
jgi:hypothetical protein